MSQINKSHKVLKFDADKHLKHFCCLSHCTCILGIIWFPLWIYSIGVSIFADSLELRIYYNMTDVRSYLTASPDTDSLLLVQFCIAWRRDSDIKHGLINDLLNTGPDLEPGAEIENWIIDADGVQSPEQWGDQSPIFIGPCYHRLKHSGHLAILS